MSIVRGYAWISEGNNKPVYLLVEILLVGLEFGFAEDTAAPPGLYESCPISCELNECRRNGQDSYMQTAVP